MKELYVSFMMSRKRCMIKYGKNCISFVPNTRFGSLWLVLGDGEGKGGKEGEMQCHRGSSIFSLIEW